MEKNLFEIATKEKYRYPYKGMISTEDLFDLSVESLDTIFKSLNAQVKKANEESLLVTKTSEDEILENKISIVKYIFTRKLEETNNRLLEKERKEKKQKLMAILATKQDEELKNKSVDEIQKMIEELNN